jgi:hypothetical protein
MAVTKDIAGFTNKAPVITTAAIITTGSISLFFTLFEFIFVILIYYKIVIITIVYL